MRKKYNFNIALCLVFLTFNTVGICQYNMVPNPSFEQFTTCPVGLGQIESATYWTKPVSNVSPELFNACANGGFADVPQNYMGYQFARTGLGYAGICNGIKNFGQPNTYREYIQTELLDTLHAGVEYTVSFYVSAGDSCGMNTNNFGAYFSNIEIDTLVSPISNLPFQPQFENPVSNDLSDRIGWTHLSGSFIANGDERYLILGNFKDSSNSSYTNTGWGTIPSLVQSAYLYVDDVLVAPTDSITSISDLDSHSEITISTENNGNIFGIESHVQKIISFDLINNLGQIIISHCIINDNMFQLGMHDYSQGIYIIRIKLQNDKIHILKIFNP